MEKSRRHVVCEMPCLTQETRWASRDDWSVTAEGVVENSRGRYVCSSLRSPRCIPGVGSRTRGLPGTPQHREAGPRVLSGEVHAPGPQGPRMTHFCRCLPGLHVLDSPGQRFHGSEGSCAASHPRRKTMAFVGNREGELLKCPRAHRAKGHGDKS